MDDLIIVSNWEKVEKDDFYLSDEWIKEAGKDRIKEARKLQKEDNLYEAYIVSAKNYAIFNQMDASQVFIDNDGSIILHCESVVINSEHTYKAEYEY